MRAPTEFPSSLQLNKAISACAKGERWQEALELLRCRRRDAVSFNAAQHACVRGAQWQMALLVFQHMETQAARRNVVSFNTAISACEKGAHWELALSLLAMSREHGLHDQITRNAAVSACEKASCWRQALALLEPHPDLVTYNACITACAGAAEWRPALKLLSQVDGDVVSYTAAMSACRGAWQHVLALLQEMQVRQVEGNLMTFNTAIASLAKAKQWSLALRCFHALRRKSAVSYGAAMGAVDRWEEALELLGRACQEVQVNVVLFNACLGACAERQAWRWALQLPRQLEQRSLRRTSSTQSAAVSALVRHWSWALLLLDGGNAIVYNAAIAVCAGGHQRSAALSLLAELRRISLERDAISYTSALGLGATWTEALRLAERARAEQLLDLVCCGAAVNACELAAQWLAAVQLLAATQRLSFQQDDAIYNSVISACKGAVVTRNSR